MSHRSSASDQRRKELLLELYIVMDQAFFGKGVFAVFSSYEKAWDFTEAFVAETGHICNIRLVSLLGTWEAPSQVYAVHIYDQLHDVHVFDGLYGAMKVAREAAGKGGLVLGFAVDRPETKEVLAEEI
jgi:hypothetical protein